MRDVLILFLHVIVTVIRLARPGGLRSVVAESLLVKHQLRILNRGCKRAPNQRAAERFIASLCTLFIGGNGLKHSRNAITSTQGECILRTVNREHPECLLMGSGMPGPYAGAPRSRSHR